MPWTFRAHSSTFHSAGWNIDGATGIAGSASGIRVRFTPDDLSFFGWDAVIEAGDDIVPAHDRERLLQDLASLWVETIRPLTAETWRPLPGARFEYERPEDFFHGA